MNGSCRRKLRPVAGLEWPRSGLHTAIVRCERSECSTDTGLKCRTSIWSVCNSPNQATAAKNHGCSDAGRSKRTRRCTARIELGSARAIPRQVGLDSNLIVRIAQVGEHQGKQRGWQEQVAGPKQREPIVAQTLEEPEKNLACRRENATDIVTKSRRPLSAAASGTAAAGTW